MASNLFNLVAQAKAHAKQHHSTRRAATRLEDAVKAFEAGRGSRWEVDREIRRFTQEANEVAIYQHQQSNGVRKYVPQRVLSTFDKVTQALGPLGNVLKKLFQGNTSGFDANEARAAGDLLETYGLQQLNAEHNREYTKTIEAALQSIEDHNWSVEAAMESLQSHTRAQDLDDIIEERHGGSKHQQARQDLKDKINTPRLSKEHFTPGSSNVYSFQFDYLTLTCYVRYKAPTVRSSSVINVRSAGGMQGMAGDMGSTVTGKSDGPGQLYAYYDVPIKVFKTLVEASSAGGAVWDELRQRGSVHGHKFRYSLVEGALIPGEDGKKALYVSRRATKSGFASRSVATPGTGRRRFVSSSLPQDKRGHDVIRSMRHRPSRGTEPNRGRGRRRG